MFDLGNQDWYSSCPWLTFGSQIDYRKLILERTNGLCAYCGELEATTIDHVIPRSCGGSLKPKNLIGACVDCNGAKADMMLDEFRELFFTGRGGEFYFESIGAQPQKLTRFQSV